jgi:hypothetical protein
MVHTKLEVYIETLKILAHGGPLKLDELGADIGENRRVLSLLLTYGLIVKSRAGGQGRVYSIGRRGVGVLMHFRELPQEPAVLEKAYSGGL